MLRGSRTVWFMKILRTSLLTIATVAMLVPTSSFALGKRTTGKSQTMWGRSSTQAFFQDRGFWLPGAWTILNGTGSKVTLTKKDDKRVVVTVRSMNRDLCVYGLIRQAALKAWGGTFQLDGSKARIEPISFGTSKFKGYTWVVPSDWKGERHWCLGQDLKSAVEVIAPEGAPDIIAFIKQDLMLQLAVRTGRSVMPYPSASGSGTKTLR